MGKFGPSNLHASLCGPRGVGVKKGPVQNRVRLTKSGLDFILGLEGSFPRSHERRTLMKKPILKLSNNEKAVCRVVEALKRGRVLTAYNALDRETTTAGTYNEAVDCGHRFAVIGWRTGRQTLTRTVEDAAWSFVSRVGSTRAREASL